MTRDQVSEAICEAHTLKECETVNVLLRDCLRNHPEDDDLRDEGSSLYMKLIALQPPVSPSTLDAF